MGHPIINADEPGEAIYILVEGEVIIQRCNEPIKILKPGDFLDEKLLKPGLSAIAKTNCRLVSVDQKIVAALTQYPLDFRVAAIQIMVERLTWRVSPPIQLAIRPQALPLTRNFIKIRSNSDTYSVTVPV